MINSMQKLSVAFISTILLLGVAKTAEAANFVAHTRGHDNRNNPDFFSFILEGDETESDLFIQSITFDLAAGGDQDAFFDYSGYAPTLNLSSLQGLTGSDITFTSLPGTEVFSPFFNPDDGDTSALKISFESGSFGIGDAFKFGAETDSLNADIRDDGDDYARAGVEIILELEDGTIETVTFQEVENNHSIAIQSIIQTNQPPEPEEEIPEPVSIFGLLTAGLFGKLTLKQSAAAARKSKACPEPVVGSKA